MADSSAFRGLTRAEGSRRPAGHPGREAVRHCRSLRGVERQPTAPTAEEVPAAGVTVGPVGPREVEAAVGMHSRCSSLTLARRYHGSPGEADRYLRHLLDPRHGQSSAAWATDGRLVGLGHLLWDGEDAEVAVLVEDEWQGRGVGGALLHRLIAGARSAGRGSVYVVTQSSNTGMLRAMRSTGLPLEYQQEEGALVVSALLAPGPPAGSALLRGPGGIR